MFKKVFVFLLVHFIAFYPVLAPLANASTKTDEESKSQSVIESELNSAIHNPKSEIANTYGKLPLYFIQNNGQIDEKVKYYEKGSGHTTYFTKEGIYLALIKNQESSGKNEIASGLKPFAMTPPPTHDSRLTTSNL